MTNIPSQLEIPKLKFNSLSRNHQSNLSRNNTARLPAHNLLSHTFRAFHDKSRNEKTTQSNHLFDLLNTFDLSIQMIESVLPSSKVKQEDKAKIKKAIKRLKEIHQKKKQLNKDKVKLRSKILVDHQVAEEAKRRKEENANYYQDQMDGIGESIDKKNTFIKKFHKKFNEVEIYVQRECETSFKFRQAFHDFEINTFLYANEKLLRAKIENYKSIKALNTDIKLIIKENIELKKREEFITEDNETESDQFGELLQTYNSKIQFFKVTNAHLKLVLRNVISQVKIKSIQKNILDAYPELEENKANNNNGNDNECEDNGYINQSLTIKETIEDHWENNNDALQNKTGKNSVIGWDISCIEKTDDN